MRGPVHAKTAVKYARRRAGWDAIRNKNVLFAKAVWYDTVEITWGWPETILAGLDSWTEVAVVRSGFGRPFTPKDGQTVFRKRQG